MASRRAMMIRGFRGAWESCPFAGNGKYSPESGEVATFAQMDRLVKKINEYCIAGYPRPEVNAAYRQFIRSLRDEKEVRPGR